MTIQTTRSALLSALSAVVPASATKSAHAILDGVLVSPSPFGVQLCCTDLTVAATAEVACEQSGATFVVVAALLRKVVDAMPEGPLALTHDGEKGRVTVKGGRSTSKLPTRDAADFPKVPSAPAGGATVKAGVLKRVLIATRHAAKVGDAVPNKDGTHLLIKAGKCMTTSTNGHEIARAWDACEEGAPVDALVPSTGVAAILRAIDRCGPDEDVTVVRSDRHLFVSGVSVLLYEEKPMPADKVIASSAGKAEIRVQRAELIAAIKRAVVTADEHGHVLLACRGAEVTVSAGSQAGDTGTVLQAIAAPDERDILCDAHYLLGQLEQVPDDETCIRYREGDALAPLVFESATYVGVLSPMRP